MNISTTAGLYIERFLDRCPADLIDNQLSCKDDYISDALTLMKCVGINNVTTVLLNIYSESDHLDIFPFLFTVGEIAKNYSISTSMLIMGYYFITKRIDDDEDVVKGYVHPKLLFKPLQWSTWLVIIFGLLLCFLLIEVDVMLFNKNIGPAVIITAVTMFRFTDENCFGVLLMVLYVTNLTTIVNVKPQSKVPFNDIEELTYLVASGEKTLATDNFQFMFA